MASAPLRKADFAVTDRTPLDTININRRFGLIIDAFNGALKRIEALEVIEDNLVELGLDRINEVLEPGLAKVNDAATLGFLIGSSTTNLHLIATHSETFVITDGRALFTPTPFLIAINNNDYTEWAILGYSGGYNSTTGSFIGNVLAVHGDPNSDNWTIAASGATYQAELDVLAQATTARDDAVAANDSVLAVMDTLADAIAAIESGPVASVAGHTGVVTLAISDIAGLVAALLAKVESSVYTAGIAGKQDVSAKLSAIAALTWAADRVPYFTSTGAIATSVLQSYGRILIGVADAAAAHSVLALGTAASAAVEDFAPAGSSNLQIGDTLLSVRDPGAGFVLANGASYLNATYPALQTLIGDTHAQLSQPTASPLPAGTYSNVLWEPSISLFVAVGFNGTSGAIASSPDGVTWTSRDVAASRKWSGLASSGSRIMVADATSPTVGNQVKISLNGTAWSPVAPIQFASNNLNLNFIGSLMWAGAQWIAFGDGVGASGLEIKTSANDGATWTARTSSLTAGDMPGAVAYGNNVVVQLARSASGVWQTSTNGGANWTRRAGGPWLASSLTSVVFVNGMFIASGVSTNRGAVFTSADGVTWTTHFVPLGLVVPNASNQVVMLLIGRLAQMWAFRAVGQNTATLLTSDLVSWRLATADIASTSWMSFASDGNSLLTAMSTGGITKTAFDTDASHFRVPDMQDAAVPRWIRAA